MKLIKPSEYAILLKAKALPMGAVRMYGNGEWFRKIGGAKGWEYVGKNGGAKAKQVVEEAKAKGLPVVTPSAKGSVQKPSTEKKSAMAKKPKVNLGAKVNLERWAKDDPRAFKAALAHAINVKYPHPMFESKDIEGKFGQWKLATMVQVAAHHGLEAPKLLTKPEGWDKLSYPARLKANREYFIKEIFAARPKRNPSESPAMAAQKLEALRSFDDKALLRRAEIDLGQDKVAIENAKAGTVPEGWDDLKIEQKINLNRKLFIEQMLTVRKALQGKEPFDPKDPVDQEQFNRLMKLHDFDLKDKMVKLQKIKKEEEVEKARVEAEKAEKARLKVEKAGGWDNLPYADRLKVDKKLFIQEIIAARPTYLKLEEENSEILQASYERVPDSKLLARAERFMGPDKQERMRKDKNVELLKEIFNKDTLNSPQEKELASGNVTSKTQLGAGHINSVELLEIKKADGSLGKAIFKPIDGESYEDLRAGNIPSGEQWKRERLAYMFDQILDMGIVPPVIIKEVGGKAGAMMDFVEGKVWAEADGATRSKVPMIEWQKIVLHDWLTGNTDRHSENWMVTKEGKLWGIDNGLAFPEQKNFGKFVGIFMMPFAYLKGLKNADGTSGLAFPSALIEKLTPENKKKCIAAMKMFNIGGNGVSLFEKRWDYIVNHKSLVNIINEWRGFLEYPAEDKTLREDS